MKRKSAKYILPILLLLAVLSIVFLVVQDAYIHRYSLTVSHESGIYNEDILFSVETRMPATVYYTLSGQVPNAGYEDTFVYEEPLLFELKDQTAAYSVQFYCIFEDGTASEIYQRDFLLDREGAERFTTTYVVSVVGEEDLLFGSEQGILVGGKPFEEYLAANPDLLEINMEVPGNYWADVEVPVHASIFLKDGTRIINQNCGIKVCGNATRAKNQKSLRLTARYDYDAVNEFTYPFLPTLKSAETNATMDQFQRITLHNSGDDNGFGFVRTQLVGELASQWGYPDVLLSESATVFVNGKYMGVYWLQNTFDDRYFQEKYGDYAGEMVVVQGMLNYMRDDKAEDETELYYVNEYNAFCEWVNTADIQNDEDWQKICDTIDIANFADYMAIEYYTANYDWPTNNVKVYRYIAAEDETYRDGTVFDGRYRYLMYDVDYAMGLIIANGAGSTVDSERLELLTKTFDFSRLFGRLMEREEFKQMFLNSVLCLMGESFSYDSVEANLKMLNELHDEELRYMVEDTTLLHDILGVAKPIDMEDVEAEWQEILDYAERRPDVLFQELDRNLNCGETIDLQIQTDAIGDLYLGDNKVGQEFSGKWLANVPVFLSFDGNKGVRIKGYKVNDAYLEGSVVHFMPGEMADAQKSIVIQPVYETEAVESLAIAAYHTEGDNDYIVLENNGQAEILLADYVVSDSLERTTKGRLPAVKLLPGEQFTVYGQQYAGEMTENSTVISFAWNTEEQILLMRRSTEEIIDSRN